MASELFKLQQGFILPKIRNYANLKIQNGKTLPKLNIGIYSKFGQYYRYDITMYDFIHIIQFLIPIWSWISKMMLENETFFTGLNKESIEIKPSGLSSDLFFGA